MLQLVGDLFPGRSHLLRHAVHQAGKELEKKSL